MNVLAKYGSLYQLISYCMRAETSEQRQRTTKITEHIVSNFTFAQLSEKRVNSEDLLSWSAPMDSAI